MASPYDESQPKAQRPAASVKDGTQARVRLSRSVVLRFPQLRDARRERQRVFIRRYIRKMGFSEQNKTLLPSENHYGFGASSFWASVGFALEGLRFAFQYERNFRIDVYLCVLAVALGFVLRIELHDWVALIQMLGFILFAEMANTVLEWVVDLLTNGAFDIRAKRIKDMAAATCLIVAVCAYGVTALIFWPYLAAFL